MRRLAILALALSALTGLAGCRSGIGEVFDTRKNAGPCPSGASLADTARIVEFIGEKETYDQITYTGEVVGVKVFCRYVEDDPLLAEVEIDFAFGKGPQGEARQHDYPYFVAVTRRNSRVLAKQHFMTEANFRSGPVSGRREVVSGIVIPRADNTISGANFEILVGFDLTPEQLAYNRAGKRFLLGAGSAAE